MNPRNMMPRRFVPQDSSMGQWEDIEALGAALLSRTPNSPQELEKWLKDQSELNACLQEELTRRYVHMTTHTDNEEYEKAYLFFINEIAPRLKVLGQKFDLAYLANLHHHNLPRRYRRLNQLIENRVALFRQENIPLETEEANLQQQYQKITGAMTVIYRGEEKTFPQMMKLLEGTDRSVRQEAWQLVVMRRLQDREALNDLFARMLTLRTQIAKNAGFTNYIDYIFRKYNRFDYGPEDCSRFHEATERHFVPIATMLAEHRKQSLRAETLRPWDMKVDPAGRAPLQPFRNTQELISGCENIFGRVDPQFAEWFRFMQSEGLLDLDSRKHKAPGGYQTDFTEKRWPFIFMNSAGTSDDIDTLLHEGGHAFNLLSVREEPITEYLQPPIEFAEVASMGMEMALGAAHLDVFYKNAEDLKRAQLNRLEDVVNTIPWVATIDAFQHWLYSNPNHTPEERKQAWIDTFQRFQPSADWTGYEDVLGHYWHKQLHIFLHPFYYIEYGIAGLGALQLGLRAQQNYKDAATNYRKALTLGGSVSLPELFETANIRFSFADEIMSPLAAMLKEQIQNSL